MSGGWRDPGSYLLHTARERYYSSNYTSNGRSFRVAMELLK